MRILNIVFIIVLITTTTIHYFKIIETGTFIGVLSASITLYIGILQQRLNNDRIFKELFQNFNNRYDSYNDLINSCNRDRTKKLTEVEKNLVIDYINMCAEEYLWFKGTEYLRMFGLLGRKESCST